MTAFQPIGDRARWRIIYDILTQQSEGDIVTYETLGEALGLNPETERHAIQMAVRRAAQEYEVVDKRALDVIPNVGYRVVHAPEHLELARRHQKRSSRALQRGHSKAVNVDLTGVDPTTRHAFEVVARAFAMQMDFNRRLDVRQARLENALESMEQQVNRTDEEVAELKRRLARLEQAAD